MNIDLAGMFPEAARRVEILEGLRKSWAGVVGAVLARNSWPSCLGVNELRVEVRDRQAGNMLLKMKGNILRALERRGYVAEGDFALKVVAGEKRRQEIRRRKGTASGVKVDDETVKMYMSGAPEGLPEDINYSISHLRAFLDKRFHNKT